jgi:hypothetical protein
LDTLDFQNPICRTVDFLKNPLFRTMSLSKTHYFGHMDLRNPIFQTKQVLTPIQNRNTIIIAEWEVYMANRKFTPNEISELKNNKYVLDVSPSVVHFSSEFKEEFWNALIQGKLAKDIVKSMGINPDVLGETRLAGLKIMIKNEVKKGNGFRDLNTYMQGCNGYMSAENRIKYLEMQLAYKDQEIEFLKKIVSLDPEARKS